NDLTILGGGNYNEDYEAGILEHNSGEFLLRLDPLKDEIEYQYARMWVSTANWFPTKIEFYDESGQLKKVLINREIEQIDGNWTAREITMEDVQKGSRTVLSLTEVRYNVSLDEQIFTTRYMRRQS
ncbi:MAG TPA: outer membrane lipoprotein-sorting protein, partial [bacterium]|nr:outer membrane lipoprotein-sorting protein [bacterium]